MKHLAFLLVALAIPAYAFSDNAYVHSVKAAVYKSPTMKSKKVTTLVKGDEVSIIKEKGSWYKIKSNTGKKGWVYKFMLKKQPVTSSDKLYTKLRSFFYKIESISGKSRRRPSSYSTTAAARGLRDKRRHFAGEYQEDYESLKKIETMDITENEVLTFLEQGVKNETR